MSKLSKLAMATMLPTIALGMTICGAEHRVLSHNHTFREKNVVKGYDHKEHTPEEKRVKYLHKLKIKERRKRKGCRKGGRI